MKSSNSNKKHNCTVLIGSSGTGSAFAAILALRRNWGSSVRIIATDTNPKHLVTSSLMSDKFFQVPDAVRPEFQRDIKRIIQEEDIDTYIPFIDHEIFIAALLYEEEVFKEKFRLQVKNSTNADICYDKYKSFLWLSALNINTPLCLINDSQMHNNYKLILKPRKGFGSKVKSLSEIKDCISHYNLEEYIIQEECQKPEVTVDVCLDKNRNFFNYICRERIEVKSGVCTKARMFYDKKLEEIAYTIADKLDLNSFCYQVMNYKGEWAVTDINARLGAGTAMSFAVGMDFFSGMFAILWGEDPSKYFRPLQKETFVTRQYSDFLMIS